jgi:hypothetical protein
MKNSRTFRHSTFRVAVGAVATVFILAGFTLLTPSGRADNNNGNGNNNSQGNNDSNAKAQIGLSIAPVPLNIGHMDKNVVGLGSYIVNAAGRLQRLPHHESGNRIQLKSSRKSLPFSPSQHNGPPAEKGKRRDLPWRRTGLRGLPRSQQPSPHLHSQSDAGYHRHA